jgi:hypothetical protein
MERQEYSAKEEEMRYWINVMRSLWASRRFRVNQIVSIEGAPHLITAKHWRSCDTVMFLWGGSGSYPYHWLREATGEDVEGFFQLTSESEFSFERKAA